MQKALVNFDEEMTDAFNEIISHDVAANENQLVEAEVVDFEDEPVEFEVIAEPAPVQNREGLTYHAQGRMASFQAFDEVHRAAREELYKIGQSFAAIVASHTRGSEFLEDCAAEIVRSSELELANGKLLTHNRKLEERIEKLEQLRERQDALLDASKIRESKLTQEIEVLRGGLNDTMLECVETKSQLASVESLRCEMQLELSAQTVDIERLSRDVEALREKNVVLRLDLDLCQQKSTDYRRKLEETQSLLAVEAARSADAIARLGIGDAELLRLQKHNDAVETRLHEVLETLQAAEQDLTERDRRYHAELQSLRSETAQLGARLQTSKADQAEKQNQLSLIESRLRETEAERRILEHKLAQPSIDRVEMPAVSEKPSPRVAAGEPLAHIKAIKQRLDRASKSEKNGKASKRRSASLAARPAA